MLLCVFFCVHFFETLAKLYIYFFCRRINYAMVHELLSLVSRSLAALAVFCYVFFPFALLLSLYCAVLLLLCRRSFAVQSDFFHFSFTLRSFFFHPAIVVVIGPVSSWVLYSWFFCDLGQIALARFDRPMAKATDCCAVLLLGNFDIIKTLRFHAAIKVKFVWGNGRTNKPHTTPSLSTTIVLY